MTFIIFTPNAVSNFIDAASVIDGEVVVNAEVLDPFLATIYRICSRKRSAGVREAALRDLEL